MRNLKVKNLVEFLVYNKIAKNAILPLLIILILPNHVFADDCSALGGSLVSGDCVVSGSFIRHGNFNINESLHFLGNGSVDATGFGIRLAVNGDLVMEDGSVIEANDDVPPSKGNDGAFPIYISATGNVNLKGKAAIEAEDRISGGDGADIVLSVGKNLSMENGSKVSSSRTTGGGNGIGGNINISVDGLVDMDPGSIVAANNFGGRAGDIFLSSNGKMNLDGLVSSGPSTILLPGKIGNGYVLHGGNTHQEGGTITIKCASADDPGIVISTTGVVVSQGQDSGADVVTIEGCGIKINGLVASVGKKRGPSKVLLRSGNEIEINGNDLGSTGPNQGRVRADAVTDGPTDYLVEIFAKDHVSIFGPSTGAIFAVTSNPGTANTRPAGGTIKVLSVNSTINASGKAFQAGRLNGGNKGGYIDLQSKLEIVLDASELQAIGDYAQMGGFGTGGFVTVRSYSSSINWKNGKGDVRPVGSAIPKIKQGNITLTKCTSINITGTTFPSSGNFSPTILTSCSPTTPQLPDGENLPLCSNIKEHQRLSCVDAIKLGLLHGLIVNGTATIQNDADQPFNVSLAAYKMFSASISDQLLFDSGSTEAGAHSNDTLKVDVPSCAYQVDLVCDDVLARIPNYGNRVIAFDFINQDSFCTPEVRGNVKLSIAPFYPQNTSYIFICNSTNFTATSYNWYFGDGDKQLLSSNMDVFHRYNATGNYTVVCTAMNDNESGSDMLNITASIQQTSNNTNVSNNSTNNSTNATLNVSLSIAPFYPQNRSYVFICNATGYVPAFYDWFFGDGDKQINSLNMNVFHTYAAAGNYTVDCTAKNLSISKVAELNISVS